MTKNEIIDQLHDKTGLSKKEATEILDSIFTSIKAALTEKQDVKISNFGHFKVADKNARVGRNPKTGEEIEIPPRTVVTFKASQNLKDTINGRKSK